MGEPVPKGWPKSMEYDGGTIAFFHIDWRHQPGEPLGLTITQKAPPEPTGFNWRE